MVYMHVKMWEKRVETRRYDSALSSHYSFQPPLNSCGLSQKMFSACGNCQVESQARACYVTQFTYKS